MISKNHVIAGFNRGAETYTDVAHLQARVAGALAEKLVGISAEKILEIGCGTGLLTQHLFNQFPKANFLLTDISPSMLKQCHARFKAFPNAKLLCVDGEHLDALPNFDLITSSMTMHWFNDFALSLSRIQQKLTKRGRLVFTLLGANSFSEWRAMCEFFHYPIATPYFPSVSYLREQFPDANFQVDVIHETYPNTYTFLATLKSLGATATRNGYASLSVKEMRRLIRHFNTPITVTYEVIYGDYSVL